MVGDVVESERNPMARQDVPDRDAEGGPRKLDEGEHGSLYDGSEGGTASVDACVSSMDSWETISASLVGSAESPDDPNRPLYGSWCRLSNARNQTAKLNEVTALLVVLFFYSAS